MSPRPRTVSDAAILEAAYRAMSRISPGQLTLADIAREAGLSPSTLVQRFGSKRNLLLALARGSMEYVDACFVAVRAAHSSPLDALVAAATEMARYVSTPEEMANHLAWLNLDLTDPDFRALIRESSEKSLAGYESLLDRAVSSGELLPCDTAALARAVGAVSGGSLIGWAVFAAGPAHEWVRADLETLLYPYRVPARKRAKQPGRPARVAGAGGKRSPRSR